MKQARAPGGSPRASKALVERAVGHRGARALTRSSDARIVNALSQSTSTALDSTRTGADQRAAEPSATEAPLRPESKQQGYFPALTGMRVVAALLVYFHHYGLPAQLELVDAARRIVKEGYVGVPLFFVLSGFLITYRNYEQAKLSFGWLRTYLQDRFARIYPLVFLLMLLEIQVIRSLNLPLDKRVLILNFTLLKGYVNEWKFSILPQVWTLSAEESFYLLAPLMLLAVRRGWALLPLVLVPLAGALFTLAPFHQPSTTLQTAYFTATYTFFGAFPQFAIGAALAVVLLKLGPNFRGPRLPVFTVLGALGCYFSFKYLGSLPSELPITTAVLMPGHIAGWFSHRGIAVMSLMFPAAAAVLYFGLIVEESGLRSLLSLPLMDLLGKSSYAFYLIQQGAINVYIQTHLTPDWGSRLFLLVVASVLLHRYVETPLHALLRARRVRAR